MCGLCNIPCTTDTDCAGQDPSAVCSAPPQTCQLETFSCQLPGSVPAAPTDTAPVSTEPAPAMPEISSFGASVTSLPGGGGDVELTWAVTGATELTLQTGADTGQSVTGDGTTVSVTQTTTFTLVATNAEGSNSSMVRVEVSAQGIQDWTAQPDMGTSEVSSITVSPGGDVFVAGWALDENGNGPDGRVARYDGFSRQLLWSDLLSTDGLDRATGLALDAEGNMYVGGFTEGALNDAPDGNGNDGFVVKYSPRGDRLWTKLVSTTDTDEVTAVGVDPSGNVSLSGVFASDLETTVAFVAKYSTGGDLLWLQQFGAAGVTRTTSVDATNDVLAVAGSTTGSLDGANSGGSDAFIAVYSNDGKVLWTRQLGSPANDEALGLVADAQGNLYVSGTSEGALDGVNAGASDAFIAKYSSAGDLQWVRQQGSAAADSGTGISIDADGNLFISGSTAGTLGDASFGNNDAFVTKLSPSGDLLWTRQLGSPEEDYGFGVAAAPGGYVFLGGSTFGNLSAENDGSSRGFVTRYQ